MKKLTILAVLVTLVGLLVSSAPVRAGDVVTCGATITSSKTLTHDVACTDTGIVIGANGITLNLAGFTLSGDGTGFGVDNTAGFDRLTIKDGEISGFDRGIRALGANRLRLTRLFVNNITLHAIDILDSSHFSIKDSFVDQTGAGVGFFGEAIRLESVDHVLVQNVSILGGFVGVNFACDPCDGSEPPTNGKIEHNTIVGTFDNGILIANSTNASIEQNTIAGAGFAAIQLGFSPSTTVSGVTVHKNTVVGNTDDGILVHRGATGNTLSHNTVVGNGDNGIAVWSGASNSATSTSNTITKNEAVLNGDGVSFFDLFHDGGSSPNAWVNNTCITKLGADIPAC